MSTETTEISLTLEEYEQAAVNLSEKTDLKWRVAYPLGKKVPFLFIQELIEDENERKLELFEEKFEAVKDFFSFFFSSKYTSTQQYGKQISKGVTTIDVAIYEKKVIKLFAQNIFKENEINASVDEDKKQEAETANEFFDLTETEEVNNNHKSDEKKDNNIETQPEEIIKETQSPIKSLGKIYYIIGELIEFKRTDRDLENISREKVYQAIEKKGKRFKLYQNEEDVIKLCAESSKVIFNGNNTYHQSKPYFKIMVLNKNIAKNQDIMPSREKDFVVLEANFQGKKIERPFPAIYKEHFLNKIITKNEIQDFFSDYLGKAQYSSYANRKVRLGTPAYALKTLFRNHKKEAKSLIKAISGSNTQKQIFNALKSTRNKITNKTHKESSFLKRIDFVLSQFATKDLSLENSASEQKNEDAQSVLEITFDIQGFLNENLESYMKPKNCVSHFFKTFKNETVTKMKEEWQSIFIKKEPSIFAEEEADILPEEEADILPEEEADILPEKEADILPEEEADILLEEQADKIFAEAKIAIDEKIEHRANIVDFIYRKLDDVSQEYRLSFKRTYDKNSWIQNGRMRQILVTAKNKWSEESLENRRAVMYYEIIHHEINKYLASLPKQEFLDQRETILKNNLSKNLLENYLDNQNLTSSMILFDALKISQFWHNFISEHFKIYPNKNFINMRIKIDEKINEVNKELNNEKQNYYTHSLKK